MKQSEQSSSEYKRLRPWEPSGEEHDGNTAVRTDSTSYLVLPCTLHCSSCSFQLPHSLSLFLSLALSTHTSNTSHLSMVSPPPLPSHPLLTHSPLHCLFLPLPLCPFPSLPPFLPPSLPQELTVQREEKGTWHLSIYSSYWMVNKTGMTLHYTVSYSQLNASLV